MFAEQHPEFSNLNPKAVVMDLALTYHPSICECVARALRIADRFHAHDYVIKSVQAIRKSIRSPLSPQAKP
uniref:transposase n=1 Tax=Paenibacillus sp. FSL H7-0350 TaxID=2975345 RepID=UPI00406BFDA5